MWKTPNFAEIPRSPESEESAKIRGWGWENFDGSAQGYNQQDILFGGESNQNGNQTKPTNIWIMYDCMIFWPKISSHAMFFFWNFPPNTFNSQLFWTGSGTLSKQPAVCRYVQSCFRRPEGPKVPAVFSQVRWRVEWFEVPWGFSKNESFKQKMLNKDPEPKKNILKEVRFKRCSKDSKPTLSNHFFRLSQLQSSEVRRALKCRCFGRNDQKNDNKKHAMSKILHCTAPVFFVYV